MKHFLYTLLVCCLLQSAKATTFTVTNLNDVGAGSLRQAILDANADGTATAGSPHLINFSISGQINTSSTMPVITNHMTLAGHSTGNTIFRLSTNPNYRLLSINGAVTVTLNNLNIQGGNPGGSETGGGILNNGANLTLNNCVLEGNATGNSAGAHGAGIRHSAGVLVINNSTFKNNAAGNLGRAGAIDIETGTATLTNCTVHNNTSGNNAGGIFANGTSTLNLVNCTVVENHSTLNNPSIVAGGVFYQSGTLNMTNTILANNTSVGIPNSDLNTFAGSYSGINNQNIVEACNNFSAGFCSTAGFFSSADPNLATVSQCGLQDLFRPNTGSVAIDNGTTVGAPTTDICGTTWFGNPEIGSVESVNVASALDFDGNDDFVDIANPFTAYTNEITVEAWINIQSISAGGSGLGQGLPGIDNLATNVWLLELNPDNTISFYVNDAGTPHIAQSTSSVVGTGWHHVVGVSSATETAIYIDGVKQAIAAGISNNILNVGSANLQIGKDVRFNAGRFFDGQIDEVRIWNEALCAAKIITRKDCELVGNEDNLIHYYNFNQGSAGGSNGSETTLLDRQTNLGAQNGTLNGFGLSAASSNWVDGSTNGISGNCSSAFPEIDVQGNSVSIANNDATPSLADHTNFGDVNPASGTIVRTFTVDNTAGTGVLNLNSIFNTNTGDFTVGGITFPATVAVGATTTFTVTFDPSTLGVKNATLVLQNDDCDEGNYIFAIEGTGAIIEELAITEWLSNPSGTDSQEEWIEIHNYGSSPIDLQNWRIKDEDLNDNEITTSSFVIPPGGYVIVTNNKTSFESVWFDGCSKTNVLEVAGLELDNTTDEIILENSTGSIIWSIAYNDDEAEGRATFYTESPVFSTRIWGSQASPGVSRSGNDLTGSLGYQRNDITTDLNLRTATNGDQGSPLNEGGSLPDLVRGNSLLFDGNNDFVDVPDNDLFDVNAVTIEAWVYWTGTGANVEFITAKGNEELEIHTGGGSGVNSLRFIPTTAVYLDAPTGSLIPNQWNHIACVYDPSVSFGEIYVNGIARGAVNNGGNPMTTPITTSTSNFRLGSRNTNTFFFNGQLDEVKIWNRARTASEIRENMHLTSSSCENGLNAYFQMNETSGSNTLVERISGNNGMLTNMPIATAWLSSGVNVGKDVGNTSSSQTLTIPTGTSTQNFTSLNIEFTNHSAVEDFTVTYQAFTPNAVLGISGVTIYQNPMWTINKSTNTENFLANIEFRYPAGTFTNIDIKKYALYWRPMYSDGNWTKLGIARGMTSSTIRFGNIGVTGQFIVVQESEDNISDVRGNMYTFNGTQFIDHSTTSSGLPQGNSARTMEAWVKTTQASIGNIVSWGRRTNNNRNSMAVRSNALAYIGQFNDLTGTIVINDGAWHHVALTHDGTTMRLYVDGVLDVSSNRTINTLDQNLRIGTISLPSSGENYVGSLDEVRIWNVALTQEQIREHMHLTLKGNETGLVSYYQFNNDDPAGTVDGVKDAVGSNNGTTQNMVSTDYIPSEVAVAGGTSDRIMIGAGGVYTFPNTGVSIEFGATTPNGEIVVSRLETEMPTGNTSLTGDVDNEYFIINNYGINATFDPLIDLTFNRMNYIAPVDAAEPQASSPLQLYKRPSNAYGATWGITLGGSDNATAGSNGSIGYNATNNVTSFSQIVVLNAGPNSDLPVDFISFDAKRINSEEVTLDWVTGSETNNQGFEIERMLEHENTFSKVSWVDGQGTTPNTTHYESIDVNTYSGVSYYRLKQVDFDGSFEYSEIRAVRGTGSKGGDIRIDVYPNPVQQQLSIYFELLPKGVKTAQISIIDTRGQRVYTQTKAVLSYQTIPLNVVESLAPAVYLISIELDNGEQTTKRFVKE